MEALCHIGKLVATFGVGGQLVLHHALGKKTALKGLEAVFIALKGGEMLPYFLEAGKVKNEQETYLKLEGIDSKETAAKLVGREVWIPEKPFRKFSSSNSPIALLGFQVYDGDHHLGEILEVIEQPHQVLCRIAWKGKDALIPLHEHFLLSIDQKKKTVTVQLPEGLMDIYT